MVVLICISLTISDVEHLFMLPTSHLLLFFGKMSVQFFCSFLIRLLVFFFVIVFLLDIEFELYELFIHFEY